VIRQICKFGQKYDVFLGSDVLWAAGNKHELREQGERKEEREGEGK
jgi:hypothetical protein